MPDIFATEKQYSSGLYAKHEIAIVRGQGARVWDNQGREYIDCMAGHGVANLGHAHPDILAAITEQAARLITCTETYYNDQRSALMEKLASLTPGLDRVFFCNSGAESIEAAIKFARISTGRTQIFAAKRGFHGRTMGALSATWNKKYRQPFEPLVPGFSHTSFNNIQALEGAVTSETAAVMLEIIQGEGGVHCGDTAFLHTAERLCREKGALLIIDEVQTGFGRTGDMFAFEHDSLSPDLLCLAKSMAGGVPMGAVLIGPNVQNLTPGMHASTFGGNPLACAASLATIRALERDRLPHEARQKGDYLLARLREIQSPLIRAVRGRGLMVGIELKRKVAPYLRGLSAKGILALPAGMTVVRLLPPLVITYDQIDRVVAALDEIL